MALSFLSGIAHDLSGKGQFRLFLQPVMAVLLGIYLGAADANVDQGRAPSDAIPALTFALVMDAIFQHLTLGYIRPLAAVMVGMLLGWIPFAGARALTNRIWRQRYRPAERAI